MLSIPGSWVWDFWLADDGSRYHLFYLNAPKHLGDPAMRHRFARIGHATSEDLSSWTVEGDALSAGAHGSFDEAATWTGSVVRGDDGLWRMFYTGTRFLRPPPDVAHVESVGVAVSADLQNWEKQGEPVARADARWYQTYDEGTCPEEAWRDPWVFRDPGGEGWHMLVTARSSSGELDDRGVIGHAWSPDLADWEVRPPLSAPGSGFQHLEVPQVVLVGQQWLLVFSCATGQLASSQESSRVDVGSWAGPIDSPTQSFDLSRAFPITSSGLYSSRLVQQRDGVWALLGFINGSGRSVPDTISDPIPITLDGSGHPILAIHDFDPL